MATPLQLLIGTNSLRNRIKHQGALLQDDIVRVKTQTAVLKQSAVHSAVSLPGLAASTAAGFLVGRKLFQPKKTSHHASAEGDGESTTHSGWWELLMPLAIGWIRDFAIAQLHNKNEPPPQ
ncbi:MAG: hypothetical protein JWM78_1291 [Verrucomicrobiaceae bacterium]|nr:hypothetical protein [Verrucomicrobiaceae bacterium]